MRPRARRRGVVRTAWLYGAHGPNFVRDDAAARRPRARRLDVVDDQRGQPTWTMRPRPQRSCGSSTGQAPYGVWHAHRPGEATWFDLARERLRGARPGPGPGARRRLSDQFPLPAPRPAYSVLGHDAWRMSRLEPLPDWRESLAAAVADGVADEATDEAAQ